MKNINISKCLLFILALFLIFHFFIIGGIVPFKAVWGGRLNSRSEMFVFETISIVINIFMLLVVAINAGLLKASLNPHIIKISLWLMFVQFLFNTAGNVLSLNPFEKYVFSPITLMLAILCFILAFNKNSK